MLAYAESREDGMHALRHWFATVLGETATQYLEDLADELAPRGWRFMRFYRRDEFPVPVPLLWVYARATKDIGMVVNVLAVPGGGWAYHEATWGRHGYLCSCGDAQAAAAQIDRALKHRLFPSTF
ncbi:hypothetical protein [Actinomadura chibensis]|nr:hypothetical protein [Actinomadura chibensis]